MALRFDYQIPEDEYVAAQVLCLRRIGGRKRKESAVGWTALGLILIAVACIQGEGIAVFVLAALGLWWVYVGLSMFFPAFYIRRGYSKSGVVGKTYHAEVTEEGFEVAGDVQTWRVTWPGVIVKGEDERIFMFHAANTLFIFGKQYLTEDQQRELRSLGDLVPRSPLGESGGKR